MNVLTIAINGLKLAVRNKAGLILTMLMPVIMIALMGNAFKSVFETKLPKFTVLYLNQDRGPVGQAFTDFLHSAGANQFDLIAATPEQLVRDSGQTQLAIRVPADLSDKLSRGEQAKIEVLVSQVNPISEQVARSIVTAFIDSFNMRSGLALTTQEFSPNSALPGPGQGTQLQNYVSIHEVGFTAKLTNYQFFSASMLIFFLLTSCMGLGVSLINERTEKLSLRMSSFPVTKSQYLLGHIITSLVMVVFQSLTIILFTKYIFHVNWGTDYLGLGLVIILVALIASGIGIIVSTLVNSAKVLAVLLLVVFWFMTFLSGGFTGKAILGQAADFTVNKWAFNALVGLMCGDRVSDIWHYLIPLGASCLVLWLAGIVVYQRRCAYE